MNKLKRLFQAKFLGLVFSDRIKPERLKVRFTQDTYPAFYVNYFYLTDALAPQTLEITDVLKHMVAENSNSASPVFAIVNTQKLALLGHSFGGAVGLSAIANLCLESLSLCKGSFNRPKELVAGAFFGANLRDTKDEFIPINNSGIPVALLQGSLDNRALPFRAKRTYDKIQTPPKALITILGANHFSITNTNNPVGAIPDSQNSTLAQNIAVETIARWSGLFLRASVLKDKDAFDLYYTGDARDPNVAVISDIKPISKAASTMGLIATGVCSTVLVIKKRNTKNINHRGHGLRMGSLFTNDL